MLAMLGVFACRATIVPRLSLEEMVARSETIVSGQVTRVWTAWDSPHRFIWTHTEILVTHVAKGNRIEKLVVSEPGGVVDGLGMQIAGIPRRFVERKDRRLAPILGRQRRPVARKFAGGVAER